MNIKKYLYIPRPSSRAAFYAGLVLLLLEEIALAFAFRAEPVTEGSLSCISFALLTRILLFTGLLSALLVWLAKCAVRSCGIFCEKVRLGESRFPVFLLSMWIVLHFLAAIALLFFYLNPLFPLWGITEWEVTGNLFVKLSLLPYTALQEITQKSGLPGNYADDLLRMTYSIQFLFFTFLAILLGAVGVGEEKRKQEKLSCVRAAKLQEQHARQMHAAWQAKIAQRDAELGFCYEECSFFQQLHIPYYTLEHENGSFGEFAAYCSLRPLESEGFSFFFNREIPKRDGLLTEADMILVHPRAIFVVENKDYRGVVYGKTADDTWTYIDHSGKKIAFYSPIRQNEGYIRALREYLCDCRAAEYTADVPICSLIIFTDTRSNHSDEIISRIDTTGSTALVCTSQNAVMHIRHYISSRSDTVNVEAVTQALTPLSVRQKA